MEDETTLRDDIWNQGYPLLQAKSYVAAAEYFSKAFGSLPDCDVASILAYIRFNVPDMTDDLELTFSFTPPGQETSLPLSECILYYLQLPSCAYHQNLWEKAGWLLEGKGTVRLQPSGRLIDDVDCWAKVIALELEDDGYWGAWEMMERAIDSDRIVPIKPGFLARSDALGTLERIPELEPGSRNFTTP